MSKLDDRLVDFMRRKELHPADVGLLPEGRGWLLAEFGAESTRDARALAQQVMDKLKGHGPSGVKLFADKHQEDRVWSIRESGLGATAYVPGMPDSWPGWEDSAVPPERLGSYLRDFRKLLDKFGYDCALYGHFGQGCLHCRITFDLVTPDGIARWTDFLDQAADLVIGYGGSLSGEHGNGQARAFLLPKMFGDRLIDHFREFKTIWDPDGRMNPGKIVDAYRPDENLRLGTGYNPWRPKTTFQFPDDEGSFARAGLRCVGVGVCRRDSSGTMCPSYMVTREEKHSTRGRARLLFEMLQGEVIREGWRSSDVKESLDLCLACKGCKGDCPVNVDMATYKAEFLSHYYRHRLRPRSAYAFGLIARWAKLACLMPRFVNTLARNPVLAAIGKMASGMAPQRQIPLFARTTFRDWFTNRPEPAETTAPQVILWPDTFNNYSHPETARAAVRVLERAGWKVTIPERQLCCGRPLYDWGMLGLAKLQLQECLDTLGGAIRNGTPMVGLEPGCVSVFRDELINLFSENEDAHRLSRQTYALAEFLQKNQDRHRTLQINRDAIVHLHCHHRAIVKTHADEWLLRETGLKYETLDSGCCGMAGSFGFEKGDRYDVAMKCGERVLLPNVRKQAKTTLIISDGFSCREQIAQATDRQAMHLVEVLDFAAGEGASAVEEEYPEHVYRSRDGHETLSPAIGWAVTVGLGAGLVFAARRLIQRRQSAASRSSARIFARSSSGERCSTVRL
ncbi:MAG: FAD-binding and (Fe-S)-binding domain-containing protein [Acidobacteriota bacterium]